MSEDRSCVDLTELLPLEVIENVVSYLDVRSVLTCLRVSKTWNKLFSGLFYWREMCDLEGLSLCDLEGLSCEQVEKPIEKFTRFRKLILSIIPGNKIHPVRYLEPIYGF